MLSPSRQSLANAIRMLSADAVQSANSGHPGAPMGMADIAEVLWNDFLVHNPNDPSWVNRDRFVLSNGHGSMLIYSLLHLSGYEVAIEDLRNFRQLHSKTPGHPEFGYTPGVETTTGPLGQGVANAVGMSIAQKTMAATFNTPDFTLIDHFTYVFMGDGCMMEGISHEVCSLAGTLGLGKLIAFWDDNGISIDGEVAGWFTDNTPQRFESYGWHVVRDVDGHNPDEIRRAIEEAQANEDKPSLICCKTIIGKGSPNKSGQEICHGSPLGDDELALVRSELNWEFAPFVIPETIQEAWNARDSGRRLQDEWNLLFEQYQAKHPELGVELERRINGDLPAGWQEQVDRLIKECDSAGQTIASRKASLQSLNKLGPLLPELIGGSADLAGSNYTIWDGSVSATKNNFVANYLHFGVREFAMAAISNGISVYGGFKVYGGTFLVFADYMRNGMRMSALMKQPVIYVLTHDSIGLGEDGPTHQPVEHVSSLRLIPNMSVWRPCDAVESLVAWRLALEVKDQPSSLIFSRQNLAHQSRSPQQIDNISRGGYNLYQSDENPTIILIATGSEVEIAMQAATALETKQLSVRVVSMPSTDCFDAQDVQYRSSVLPVKIKIRVAIEAGISDYWYKYVGLDGRIVGMTTFGESGPAAELFEYFGLTVDRTVENVLEMLKC